MKNKITLLLSLVIAIFVSQPANAQKLLKDSLSYGLAVQIAESLKQGKILDNIDFKVFNAAIEDVVKGKARMTQDESRAVITAFLEKEYNDLKSKNLSEGKAFLDKNKTQPGVVTLPSGLQYKILTKGNGVKPLETDEIEVHYKGTLIDGREFDSSYSRGESVKFLLNRVIKGWIEGLQNIDEGGKIVLFIPPQLAYGENSPQGSIIEPNSVLIFEIELLKIAPKQGQELIKAQPIAPPPSND